MPTNSIRKPIVIEDDEACKRFRELIVEAYGEEYLTSEYVKPIVIEGDEACQRFRDALEKFESQPQKIRIESKTSSLERGIELLRKRYSRESSELPNNE